MSLGTADQGVRDAEADVQASGAKPDPEQPGTGLPGLVQRVFALKPVRVVLHYNEDNGPLLASGMTYQAIFALFAALWFAFSVAGFVVKGDPVLQSTLFSNLNRFIPRLVAYDGQPGAVKAATLLDTTGLSWSSAVSLVGVLYTAVGFLGTLRTAIRIMFGLPGPTTNPVLLKLKDLGWTVAFGAVLLLTAVISLVSNTLLGGVAGLLGLGHTSALEQIAVTAVSTVLLFVIDTALVAGAFRLLSGIPIPRKRLFTGALIGGAGLGVLQTVGTTLLSGATRNPLVGTFATLIGVLLYFNFANQVVLVAASWIAVGMTDAGIDARSLKPQQRDVDDAKRLEEARRRVADANQREMEDRMRTARGLERWRLARELERERRAEQRRRLAVPTETEFREAQKATSDDTPDAAEIAATAEERPLNGAPGAPR
ncbi:MAG: rane protein [Microbacteriaceae bacterium]|nr:rane protein [Microbacteriaceae bacterium]